MRGGTTPFVSEAEFFASARSKGGREYCEMQYLLLMGHCVCAENEDIRREFQDLIYPHHLVSETFTRKASIWHRKTWIITQFPVQRNGLIPVRFPCHLF